jgi:oligosaccharide repeat unit polymerase
MIKSILILKQIQFLLIVISIILYTINLFSSAFSNDFLTVIILIVFIWSFTTSNSIGISFYHPYRLFLLMFFLYNIGGFVYGLFMGLDFFSFPFGSYSSTIYTDYAKSETLFSILFFLLFLHVSVLFFYEKSVYEVNFIESKFKDFVSIFGLRIFYFALIPAYYYFFNVIIEAYLLGGYSTYAMSTTEGTTNLPFIIRISDDIFKFGFWLFLSTRPLRKNLIIPTILYFLPFVLMSIFTGSRVYAIVQGVSLITYFAILKYVNTKGILIFISVFICFSVFIGIFRNIQDYNLDDLKPMVHENEKNPFEEFFTSQGISAHTIALSVVLVESNDIKYSLRYLFEPLLGNNGYQDGKGGADYYFLADKLSYHFLNNFDSGGGLGSSIVAEFYVLGGVFGVMFFSFLFGLLIIWMSNLMKSQNGFMFFLLLLPGFYYTARSHPLTAILFSGQQMELFILFLVFMKAVESKNR